MAVLSSDLKHKKCVPCEGGVAPLTPDEYVEATIHFVHKYIKPVHEFSKNLKSTKKPGNQ